MARPTFRLCKLPLDGAIGIHHLELPISCPLPHTEGNLFSVWRPRRVCSRHESSRLQIREVHNINVACRYC